MNDGQAKNGQTWLEGTIELENYQKMGTVESFWTNFGIVY